MNILLCQCDLQWEQPQENLSRISALIESESRPVDMIILPEMFSTGFCTEPQGVAEGADGVSLEWMRQTAQRAALYIVLYWI
jgi:predicted amidohydrolase